MVQESTCREERMIENAEGEVCGRWCLNDHVVDCIECVLNVRARLKGE